VRTRLIFFSDRDAVSRNGVGIRLGSAGIYTSYSSSSQPCVFFCGNKKKKDIVGDIRPLRQNAHNLNSSVKAMLVCRVVIGNPCVTSREDNAIKQPPLGYDCVFAKPGDVFGDMSCMTWMRSVLPAWPCTKRRPGLDRRGRGGIRSDEITEPRVHMVRCLCYIATRILYLSFTPPLFFEAVLAATRLRYRHSVEERGTEVGPVGQS